MVFDTQGAERVVVSMPAKVLRNVAAKIIKVVPFLGFHSSALLNQAIATDFFETAPIDARQAAMRMRAGNVMEI